MHMCFNHPTNKRQLLSIACKFENTESLFLINQVTKQSARIQCSAFAHFKFERQLLKGSYTVQIKRVTHLEVHSFL